MKDIRDETFDEKLDLYLSLTLKAPRALVWRCLTEPELLKRWFAPKPFTTPIVEIDVRPGGRNHFVMRTPDGEDMPNDGVYLEVVAGQKLVATDAFSVGWVPSNNPFMTSVLFIDDTSDGGTHYQALVRHWTEESCKMHAEMGFHDGWTTCARQLDEVALSLKSEK